LLLVETSSAVAKGKENSAKITDIRSVRKSS
jgi:hypothetical protein